MHQANARTSHPTDLSASPLAVLSVNGVSKKYGETVALEDVSFTVERGEVVGLLGPNGAGKTTLLESICGLRTCDLGFVEAFGDRVAPGDSRVWSRMAISLPARSLPSRARVGEVVELYRTIHDVPEPAAQILSEVGLLECARRNPGKMSNGQQQRLTLALTLMGRPELMLLDEPTSELDPHGRRTVWSLIQRFMAEGERSVLLATHQMDEAATLCDKVGILLKGRLAAFGPPEALIARYCPGVTLVIETSGPVDLELRDATLVDCKAGVTRYRSQRVASTVADLFARVPEGRIGSLQILKPTLEDVFFAVTGSVLDV